MYPFIILILILLNNNLSAQNVTNKEINDNNIFFNLAERDDDKVLMLTLTMGNDFKCELNETINIVDKNTWNFKEIKTIGDNCYYLGVIEPKENITYSISNLDYNQSYNFQVFTLDSIGVLLVEKSEFFIPSKRDYIQAHNIIFKNTGQDNLEVGWINGNGTGTILLASSESEPENPKEAMEYVGNSEFGKGDKIGNHTFVIYSGKRKNSDFIKVTNLDKTSYWFKVLEYYGSSDDKKYNSELAELNIRQVFLKMQAPNLKKATYNSDNSFKIAWETKSEVDFFEIQIAEDENFSEIIPQFDNLNIGTINEIELPIENPENIYYFRIRSVKGRDISEWSNTQKISIKK